MTSPQDVYRLEFLVLLFTEGPHPHARCILDDRGDAGMRYRKAVQAVASRIECRAALPAVFAEGADELGGGQFTLGQGVQSRVLALIVGELEDRPIELFEGWGEFVVGQRLGSLSLLFIAEIQPVRDANGVAHGLDRFILGIDKSAVLVNASGTDEVFSVVDCPDETGEKTA